MLVYLETDGKCYVLRQPSPSDCLQVVSDQVRLWQADTQRVRHQTAVLYDSFPTLQKYGLAASYARQHGWLLWQNDEQGRFVSQASGHDQMRTYIKLIK